MPSVINWLDIFFVLALLVGMGIGYAQGILRQIIGLAAMYLGAIMAAMYTYKVAALLRNIAPTTPGLLLNIVAFFLILAAVMAVINFVAADAYRLTRLRLPLALNYLGGMVVGLVGTWILITISLEMLQFAADTPNWGAADAMRQQLIQALSLSQFAGATRATAPTILASIKPWLPIGVPAIFHLS